MPSIPPRSPLHALTGYRALRGLRTRGLPRELLAVREGPARFQQLCSVRLAPLDDLPCVQALSEEAAILARLHHPNILPAYESYCSHGWLTLVLAFYGAFPVDSVAAATGPQGDPLDIPAIMFVAYAVFDALAHAHGKRDRNGNPLVHGDIHPANVLVRSTGHVVLRGFRSAGPIPIVHPDPHRELAPGPYVAPELLSGHPTSPLSDVYGAAALIWHLLVGRPLRKDETPSFATTRPGLSPEVAAVLEVCLSTDPSHRRLLASTVAATVGKTVNAHAGRDCLERHYRVVLRGLPPKVRALCDGSFPSAAASESMVAPEQEQSPTPENGFGSPELSPSPTGAFCASRLSNLDYGDELTNSSEQSSAHPSVSDKRIAQDMLDELLARDRAEQASFNETSTQRTFEFSPTIAPPESAATDLALPSIRRIPNSLAPVGGDLEPQHEGTRGFRLWHVAAGIAVLSILPLSWIVGHYAARARPLDSEPSLAAALVSVTSPTHPDVVAERVSAPPSAEPAAMPPVAPSATRPTKPHARSVATQPAPPSAESATSNAVSPTVSADTPAPVTAAESAPNPVDSAPSILFNQSHLIVTGPPHGIVFVNGKPVGRTGESIVTSVCGLRFVRVAAAPAEGEADGYRWLSKGQTVKLPCGGSASVRPTIESSPAAAQPEAGSE